MKVEGFEGALRNERLIWSHCNKSKRLESLRRMPSRVFECTGSGIFRKFVLAMLKVSARNLLISLYVLVATELENADLECIVLNSRLIEN